MRKEIGVLIGDFFMARFDIATKFINEDHNVYVLHPGAAKKFYEYFLSLNAVFLDLPGIDLDFDLHKYSKNLLKEVKKAKLISDWYVNDGRKHTRPKENSIQYDAIAKTRGHSQLIGNIITLYKKIKPGDVIVCPGDGYMSKILIGEITEEFSAKNTVLLKEYGDDYVPARSVKWLNTSIIKARCSERLRQSLGNRRAIRVISDEDVLREIYSYAYPSYVMPEEASSYLYVNNAHTNLFSIGKGIDIIEYFAAMYNAQSKGELDEFLGMNEASASEAYLPDSFLKIDAGISINSPGFIYLKRAAAKSLPLYISVMMTMTASGLDLDGAKASTLINSASTVSDDCQIDVESRVNDTLKALERMKMAGSDRWQRLCEKRKKSQELLGLESPVKVDFPNDESGGEND